MWLTSAAQVKPQIRRAPPRAANAPTRPTEAPEDNPVAALLVEVGLAAALVPELVEGGDVAVVDAEGLILSVPEVVDVVRVGLSVDTSLMVKREVENEVGST